jgi:hypothetical protein
MPRQRPILEESWRLQRLGLSATSAARLIALRTGLPTSPSWTPQELERLQFLEWRDRREQLS